MLVIDASIGTLTANSYVTEAEAEAYFDAGIDASTWLSIANRKELLIHCTRLLDNYMQWTGERVEYEDVQALEWPRDGVTGIENTAIPVKVKHAVFELASYITTNGTNIDLAQVTEIEVGPITVKLDQDEVGFLIPPQITRLLSSLGNVKSLPKSGISVVNVVR